MINLTPVFAESVENATSLAYLVTTIAVAMVGQVPSITIGEGGDQ